MKKSLEKIKSWGLSLSKKQIDMLNQYVELILSKKELLNLTKVADSSHIWQRHITDAAFAVSVLKPYLKDRTNPVIADVGAGAGYIGICFKIIFPYAKVILVESVERKCAFLNWAVSKLALKNTDVMCARVDIHNDILKADIVIERAMGKLTDILPRCLKLVKKNGFLTVYQGGGYSLDAKVQAILSRHNAAIRLMDNYFLPYDDKKRTLLLFEKL